MGFLPLVVSVQWCWRFALGGRLDGVAGGVVVDSQRGGSVADDWATMFYLGFWPFVF